ncbi:MAG: peptidylprolyl isomerase [Bacteroidota bacterium]|nr:peptidylprolyl isomerase [Bacteroidota bacterium]
MRNPGAFLLVLFAACSSPPDVDETVLATVNGEVITVDEFRLNYEFGHGHLRQGNTPREDYLRFLILEQVIAHEAQRMRLDTSAAVIHAMHTLREELLIERVFEEHVLAGIEVTQAEITAAINENAVHFQFRFLPARSRAEATRLHGLIKSQGFEAARDALEEEFSDMDLELGELESPALSSDEIEPEVLAVLRDLPLNEISDPVEYRGMWYLFQVTNIQRELLSQEDYDMRAPSYRKVVYNRKAMENATLFVHTLMEPMNVVTRREGFNLLSDVLWAWYAQETPVRNLLHYLESQQANPMIARRLKDGFTVPLVAFDDQEWTIRTFLEHFTPGRYTLRARDHEEFDQRLANIVALVVRDHVLLSIANRERLDKNKAFQRTSALWKHKWLFQELRRLVVDSASVTHTETAAYYARKNAAMGGRLRPFDSLDSLDHGRVRQQMMRERLLTFADSLAEQASISINYAILDTIRFSQSTVNPTMTVHLLKSNSNKMPFPIADPNWRIPAKQ